MVKIRLARNGRKELPSYRIVVSDSRKTPRSKAIADLGYYDPIHNTLKIDEELALKWLNNGAVLSDTVKSLFRKEGINAKFAKLKDEYRANKPKKEKKVKEQKASTAKKSSPKKTTTKKTKGE